MSAAENTLACFDDLITSPTLKQKGKQKTNLTPNFILETIYIMDDVPFQETWVASNPDASPYFSKLNQEGTQQSNSNIPV